MLPLKSPQKIIINNDSLKKLLSGLKKDATVKNRKYNRMNKGWVALIRGN